MFSTFQSYLNPVDKTDLKYIVIMGDLFDKASVNNTVILETYQIIIQACKNNPEINYILLAGNHDLSKDLDKVSSFTLLSTLLSLSKFKNLFIPSDLLVFVEENTTLIFCSYNPFNSTNFSDVKFTQNNIAFGHWEVTDFNKITGIEKLNLLSHMPPEILIKNCQTIYTGHEHKPATYTFDKCKIIVTGSMQPYAHGEQLPAEPLYTTSFLKTVQQRLKSNLDYYSKINLRISLKEGEDPLDEDINAYSVIYTYPVKKELVSSVEVEKNDKPPLSFNALLLEQLEKLESLDTDTKQLITKVAISQDYDLEWKKYEQ